MSFVPCNKRAVTIKLMSDFTVSICLVGPLLVGKLLSLSSSLWHERAKRSVWAMVGAQRACGQQHGGGSRCGRRSLLQNRCRHRLVISALQRLPNLAAPTSLLVPCRWAVGEDGAHALGLNPVPSFRSSKGATDSLSDTPK